MATILPIYQAGQQTQQVPQQPYQAPQPQAQPAYQSQAASTATQDPLFQALAKYITSGPGPSYTSATEVEEIINQYNDDAGRAYLESVIQPPKDEEELKLWLHHKMAHGNIKTTLTRLAFDVFVDEKDVVIQNLTFDGSAPGLFILQSILYDRAVFHYNNWEKIPLGENVRFELKYYRLLGLITVNFYRTTPNSIDDPWPASLSINLNQIVTQGAIILPEKVTGTGQFTMRPY